MKTYLYALSVLEYWNLEYPDREIGVNLEEVYDKHTIKKIIKFCCSANKTIPDCCGKIYDSCFGSGSLTISDDDSWLFMD